MTLTVLIVIPHEDQFHIHLYSKYMQLLPIKISTT